MDTELKPCPFCGEAPTFSDVEEMDDRRYMLLTLNCCISMGATIGYGGYKGMTTDAIRASLTAELTERWNTRA